MMGIEDINGKLINKIRYFRLLMLQKWSTIFTRLLFWVLSVEHGKKNKFIGVPIISRATGSRIIIGDSCTFRSDRTSNLFGTLKKCTIATLKDGAVLKIGTGSRISSASITSFNKVTIGEHVLIGANTYITDSDWHSFDPRNRNSNVKSIPVVIEDNVWVGANCIVLKGVTIGQNSIIGAGSIVVKTIPENVIAGGNPAKILRKIENE
jgi:acetyltransferase-like isoleucine patch superfamily enzyme